MFHYNISNEEAILNFIRRYGPISKAMIARQTGITAPTVTNICNSLMEEGLIKEVGQEKTPLGRPSLLLQFNEAYEYFLIIHVRTQKLHFYIADGLCNIIEQDIVSIIGLDGDAVMNEMYKGADYFVKERGYSVKAIGMILRGPVDSKQGISVYSPHAKWNNVPFRYIFEERYHVPVYMENDMHALTTGEYYYGAGKGINELLVIKLSYGLGATLMINGQLYRGFMDGAGELGHTTVAIHEGGYKTLEEVGSETSIRNYALEAIAQGRQTILKGNENIESEDFKVTPIYEAAIAGDEVALECIMRASTYLGVAMANLINLLNPEKIVLSSDLNGAEKIIEPVLRRSIERYSYRVHPIELSFSGKGYKQILRGMIDIICTERATTIWLL